jgi:branched-chain amino acid transport system permease protein
MNRSQLEHIIRATGSIADDREIIVFLIFEPRGLHHRWEMIKAYFRLWPFSHEVSE